MKVEMEHRVVIRERAEISGGARFFLRCQKRHTALAENTETYLAHVVKLARVRLLHADVAAGKVFAGLKKIRRLFPRHVVLRNAVDAVHYEAEASAALDHIVDLHPRAAERCGDLRVFVFLFGILPRIVGEKEL